MLCYDLDLGAWVKTPGSTAPSPITPVLTEGGVFPVTVQFCSGSDSADDANATFMGCKLAGDFAGPYVGSDDDPAINSDGTFTFLLDLTTTEAKAYFAANPECATSNAVIVFVYSVGGSPSVKTAPLQIVLQNDYLSDK